MATTYNTLLGFALHAVCRTAIITTSSPCIHTMTAAHCFASAVFCIVVFHFLSRCNFFCLRGALFAPSVHVCIAPALAFYVLGDRYPVYTAKTENTMGKALGCPVIAPSVHLTELDVKDLRVGMRKGSEQSTSAVAFRIELQGLHWPLADA